MKATKLVSAHSHSFQREGGLLMFSIWKNPQLQDNILASLGGQTGNVREGVRHAAGGGL